MQDPGNVRTGASVSGAHLGRSHSLGKSSWIWKIPQVGHTTKDLYPEDIQKPQNSEVRVERCEGLVWVTRVFMVINLLKLIELYM